jgi:two-component system OmpR family sensor kinase
MAKEAERMRVLVLDLLTLARLDAQQSTSPELTDLSAAVAHHLDDGVPGMPARLDRSLQPGVLAVVDRNALATIIRNLLVNACKYAPGAEQAWRTAAMRDRSVIEVRDRGPGIAAADLPHVFERFYRSEKTRAREEGGSGLGLSIVQGLARAQGGDVSIESVEGAGTTVSVWFPSGTPVPPPPPPPPPV